MPPHLLLVFLVGLVASFLSGIAGGGAGLITIPLLIFLGIDPKVVAATTTFGGVGLGIGALSRFRQEKNLRREHIKTLTVIAVFAGLLGPFLLLAVDGDMVKTIVGTIILVIVPLFLLKKKIGLQKREVTQKEKVFGYIFYAILLTVQVAFGSGTGIAIIFVLASFFGLTMIETSATLRLPQLVSSVISLFLYAGTGLLNYWYGGALLVAMIIGGYLGSHAAIKSGNGVIKWVVAGMAVVLATVLLLK